MAGMGAVTLTIYIDPNLDHESYPFNYIQLKTSRDRSDPVFMFSMSS